MSKDSDKTTGLENRDKPSPNEEDYGYSTTVEISRKTFVGKIPAKQRAYLDIMSSGGSSTVFELGEEEVILGRSPECGIHLSVDNVSRRHAKVSFRNEEYHIEDLNSKNGTYVNGIRIVKCVLRNNDYIEIGGLKILFNEEKISHKT